MESLSHSILQSIQAHSEWAWLVVFLIAFVESIAIVGVMFPGWLLLVGIGTLIGTNILPFYPIAIAAYFGAVLGEYLSFFIGYKYHQNLLHLSMVKKHQAAIDKSQMFFKRYGNAGLFFGRFIGPIRAVMPFIAGIFQMPMLTFNLINFTSGLFWAPFYLAPGIFAGAAYQLDKEKGLEVGFLIGLIMLVGWYTFNKGKILFIHRKENNKNSRAVIKINFFLSLFVLLTSVLIFIKSGQFQFILELLKIVFH